MKKFLIFLLFILQTFLTQAKIYNVLFIGNSYVAYNDLPNTFASICSSMNDSVAVDAYNPGGFTFAMHSADATTISKIQQAKWDYVIIQAQSQEPSFSPSQVQANTYPYAKILDSMIKVYNPCASVIYYMTWGRKYGDASNCANYPPVCTYAGMQQRLRDSYIAMAMNNQSTVCPAGIVWQQVRSMDSTIELYNADLSHPSATGTYLVACSFYASIFHKQFTNTTFISNGVPTTIATIIQNATKQIVLDSIETWQQYGDLPNAKFIITNNNNPIAINNNSTRATLNDWAFGDGVFNQINTPIVQHNYTNNGFYTILLSAQNTCGKLDTASQNVTISSNVAVQNVQTKTIEIQVLENQILFSNVGNATDILLYSIDGKLLKHQLIQLHQNSISIATDNYKNIIYQIISNNKTIQTGRL